MSLRRREGGKLIERAQPDASVVLFDEQHVRYCENGALSIDNNLSERSVRPVAIGRKNYPNMGSDNGGKAAAVLYSIMASAKAN